MLHLNRLPILITSLLIVVVLAPLPDARAQVHALPAPMVASSLAQNVVIQWNTYAGSTDIDHGFDIGADGSGNVYVAGTSVVTWGMPLRPFASGSDAFVAKFGSSGELLWNSFLGGAGSDIAYKIAVSAGGDVYVTGSSESAWGTPIRGFQGSGDAFVAMLNTDGALQWNTFLGGTHFDEGRAITIDASGNAYVTGFSTYTWESPETETLSAFVAKLNRSGTLLWHTFVGSYGTHAQGIALDGNGNILLTGYSSSSWGMPIDPFFGVQGHNEIFAAKLDPIGNLTWNTFFGSAQEEKGRAVVADTSGNVYLTGDSYGSWGTPIRPFTGSGTSSHDGFVAKLASNGALQWNTFLGGTSDDAGTSIALGTSGTIDVGGYSDAGWGSPVLPYVGGVDGFVASLGTDGALLWHGFFGSMTTDVVNGIATDKNGNIWVAGDSYGPWSPGLGIYPVSPYKGSIDVMVALLRETTAHRLFLPAIVR